MQTRGQNFSAPSLLTPPSLPPSLLFLSLHSSQSQPKGPGEDGYSSSCEPCKKKTKKNKHRVTNIDQQQAGLRARKENRDEDADKEETGSGEVGKGGVGGFLLSCFSLDHGLPQPACLFY